MKINESAFINLKCKADAKRVVFGDFVIDIDKFYLCNTLFGQGIYWLDLNVFLDTYSIHKESFKIYLEDCMLGYINVNKAFNSALKHRSSIVGSVLLSKDKLNNKGIKSFDALLSTCRDVFKKKNTNVKFKAYYGNSFYLVYSLCRLKGNSYLYLLDVAIESQSMKILNQLLALLDIPTLLKESEKKALINCDYTKYKFSIEQINNLAFDAISILSLL